MKKNKISDSLFHGYLISIITTILLIIWVRFQPIDSIYWLLMPLIPAITISMFILFSRNNQVRNIIKSCNDTILYSITALTTSLLILNTISGKKIDFFQELMTNLIGYILLLTYTILLTIKSGIAASESIDSIKVIRSSDQGSHQK
ncbi:MULTISPECIES: hypothetical protein [Enterobacteriaceae]|uniref:hypothetical protein n=1 Tax=Enterobacteriaceae TaxID=543 RepID=UPI0002A36D2E|nr:MULTISPECIES: hypothetical protein [Enterobacteriaceae]EHK0944555.1 hypothetical protein [Citrobacter farmeri]EES4407662.1 hypothetical protein [Escherichia coli]EFN8797142.1 hypothetical protein [Escherichia coli]EHH6918439.1 hypothetical protein [Escherichia coli]EKX4540325.1 hypothetical protein [Citrobacter farmeri]